MAEYALVTGAARNIGRAIASRLKDDGYKVIMLDVIDPEDPSLGEFRRVDLSSSTEIGQALAWAMDGRTISRVVNCAGIVAMGAVEEVDTATFDKVIAVNVRSYIEVMGALAPAMKQQGFGRVVNVASRAALGHANMTVYSATKAAVVGMTKTWAMELAGHGITVNAIGPGPIGTDMLVATYVDNPQGWENLQSSVPVGRLGVPEDIANGVSFFLDQRSGFVTGQVLFICGGLSVGKANAT
ncbi:MAG: SDR family NAD(P)-dependent oxidoreductase [Alphaproteobacteria bacterium]|jgi:3-oxoacyl-[acyl-carrier protein] reductase